MQQINLYQDQFRDKKIWLGGKHILMIMLIFVIADMTSMVWLGSENSNLKEQKDMLVAKESAVTAEITALNQRLDARRVDEMLQKRVVEASQALQIRQQLLVLVDSSAGRAKADFSVMMEGLARQSVRGLWFVHIDIRDAGQQLLLEGSTLNAKLLPVLMQRLQHETAYSGREFRTLVLRRSEEPSARLDFVLGTHLLTEKEQFVQQSLISSLTAR